MAAHYSSKRLGYETAGALSGGFLLALAQTED